MNARKNYHYLLEDINAAKNPLDVENVVFNADMLVSRNYVFFMTEAEAIEYGNSIANGNTVNVIEVK